MKTFSRTKTIAAVALATATIGFPMTAYAGHASSSNYRYEECKKKDTEGQVLAGLAGAVAGGVAGSQVAGRGARSEGSALGAVLGAAAGIAIADKDCKEEAGLRYRNRGYNTSYPTNRNYGSTNYGSRNYGYNNTYGSRNYGTYGNRSYHPVTRTPGRAVGNPHVYRTGYSPFQRRDHTCRNGESRLDHIKWEIDEAKRERDYLKRELRYNRYDRRLERRLRDVEHRIDELKDRKKRIKNRDYGHRDYYYKTKY